jgi:hypothetical protein
MLTFLIPTNVELRGPIQNYTENVDNFLGLQILPWADTFAQFIETEETEAEEGMTAPHILGTDPKIDARKGSKKFRYDPLHFKETDVLNEADILRARQLGTFGRPVDLITEVTKLARKRAFKTMVRVEWTIWQILGGSLVMNENGVKVNETWNVQSHNPIALWSDLNNSKPLTDLDTAGDKFDGTGASMEGAIIAANRQTWRYVMANQNDADLKALDRTQWGNFRFMFSELAKIVEDKCGAIIKSYDEGYKAVGGAFTKFLPTGQLRIIGKRRDGMPVGNWWRTPSMHIMKGDQPQPGYFVVVEANGQPSTGSYTEVGQHKNPKIEVTGGIYGGGNLDFEDNVIKLAVA